MTRTRTLADGAGEWSCTQCSRRLLVRRPPEFEKIVLDGGDEWTAHVGGTGEFQPGPPQASAAAPGGVSGRDRRWLAEHGLDWGR
jgi:hypothetical protein